MVDLGTYEFKDLNTGKFTPKESFKNTYAGEINESKHVRTATKILRVIFYAKYKKVDLHKVMETQFQYLKITQHN